ncbi:hypothetical protein ACPUEJ_20965 [Vibrio tubiashii]|uniref:hypothetical protein n=1 Tax=Vibrio tubiashii TaxID=29498 RepID=UPI003CE49088
MAINAGWQFAIELMQANVFVEKRLDILRLLRNGLLHCPDLLVNTLIVGVLRQVTERDFLLFLGQISQPFGLWEDITA